MGDARLRNDGFKMQVFPYLRASTKNFQVKEVKKENGQSDTLTLGKILGKFNTVFRTMNFQTVRSLKKTSETV